jgi:hypothetical protein
MLSTILLTVVSVVPVAAQDKGPAPKLDLLARDETYRKSDAKETELVGTLRKVEAGAGKAAVQLWKVEIIVYVTVTVERLMDGKKVTVTEFVPETRVVEIYIGAKAAALEPYAGRSVKFTGKVLPLEVDGKKREIFWPGRLELPDGEPPKAPSKVSFETQDKAPSQSKDPPAKLDLFEKEDWYKDQKGDVKDFVGVVSKVEQKGGVGFGRFNPYKFEYKTTKVLTKTVKVDGKDVVQETTVTETVLREIYVGGKAGILDAYIGKKVKLTGKEVHMEVEGTAHREIWPARLEVVKPAADDDACCVDDELKIIAKARWPHVSSAPKSDKEGKQFVIKNAADLAANSPNKDLDANKEVVEKKATEEIAKLLKVDSIDWKKQMLVVVTGGVKSSGGWKIDVVSVTKGDKGCTVAWLLEPPKDFATAAFTHPSMMALVERCDGEAKFELAKSKPKAEK